MNNLRTTISRTVIETENLAMFAKIKERERKNKKERFTFCRQYNGIIDGPRRGAREQLRLAQAHMLGRNVWIDKEGQMHVGPSFSEYNKGLFLHAEEKLCARNLIWC